MSTNERIGKNIKAVRKAYGDTQEELAFKLNMSKSAIANYETRKRMVPYDVLNKIAEYYLVPTDILMYSDLDNLKSVNINTDKIPYLIEAIFPIGYTDVAMTNENFEMAYELHKLLRLKLFWEGEYDEKLAFDCFMYYMEAYDDKKSRMAIAANIISLAYCLTMICRPLNITEENCPAIIKNIIKENGGWGNIPEGGRAFDNKEENSFIELFKTYQFMEFSDSLICQLKSDYIFSDLADYYCVLGDCINIYNNNTDENNVIHNILENFKKMYTLAELENVYAIRYFSEIKNHWI